MGQKQGRSNRKKAVGYPQCHLDKNNIAFATRRFYYMPVCTHSNITILLYSLSFLISFF